VVEGERGGNSGKKGGGGGERAVERGGCVKQGGRGGWGGVERGRGLGEGRSLSKRGHRSELPTETCARHEIRRKDN